MRLIEGRIGGGPGYVSLYDTTLRATVDLGQPATRVRALLRGFDVGYSGEDHNIKNLTVSVSVGYGDDASHVQVVAHVLLRDEDPHSNGIWISTDLIEIRVDYTLIVE